ncbi:hypothetical protein [Streptomyces sp. NBC_01180]|uniref:effector-associated constant component EACC1 n=1 Tax=Streptomyces sp. NBC_01180 TaxID=2903763 RepID=UPI00386B0892|nr:hypothetical protein OG708_18245 [Streptomyces sp. NBC_01180]
MSAHPQVAEGRDIAGELASLHQWLAREDTLRGRVRIGQRPVGFEHMGAPADTLVVAVGSGGAVAVPARSVSVWLRQRRSDVTVEVSSPTGETVSVTARRVRDAQAVIETVLHPDKRQLCPEGGQLCPDGDQLRPGTDE